MSTCVPAAAVSKTGDALLTAALAQCVAMVMAAAFRVRACPPASTLSSELASLPPTALQAHAELLLHASRVALSAVARLIATGLRVARHILSTAETRKCVRASVGSRQ